METFYLYHQKRKHFKPQNEVVAQENVAQKLEGI